MKKKRLQTGLGILLGENKKFSDAGEKLSIKNGTLSISLSKIKPNINQPRKNFDQKSLKELAVSIKNQGLLVPIIVNEDEHKEDNYVIVAGERRWRAAKLAGLKDIQVVLNKSSEKSSVLSSIIENVQREDLNPLEEAEAYQGLIKNFKMTHEEVSKYTGKSRSYITNLTRILGLPKKVKNFLSEGKITFGHARALLGLKDKELNNILLNIINRKLSVRETEDLAKTKKTVNEKIKKSEEKDINILDYEKYLSLKLGYEVVIKDKKGKGVLSVKYKSLEQLEGIIKLFNN